MLLLPGSFNEKDCIEFGIFAFKFDNSQRFYCFQSFVREVKLVKGKKRLLVNKGMIVARYWDNENKACLKDDLIFKVPFRDWFFNPPIEVLSFVDYKEFINKLSNHQNLNYHGFKKWQ